MDDIRLTKRQREVLAEIEKIPKSMMLLAVFDGAGYGIAVRLRQKGLIEVRPNGKMAVITPAGRKALCMEVLR